MNDELRVIREALERYGIKSNYACDDFGEDQADIALAVLSRLEALAASFPIASDIVKAIKTGTLSDDEIAANIGVYAYRYSEDIRKERDYWKGLAMQFHDTIHRHIENHKPQGWQDACPHCGASPLVMNAIPRDCSSNMGSSDMIAVCQNCKKPMPEGWHSIHG